MIELRQARWRDAKFCYDLASDPTVRHHSLDKSKPTVLGHLKWMKKVIYSDSELCFIAHLGGMRAGVVRLSGIGEHVNSLRSVFVSISLAEAARGQKLSPMLIAAVLGATWDELQTEVAVAVINYDNLPSIKAFEKVGFQRAEDETGWLPEGFGFWVTSTNPGLWMFDAIQDVFSYER